MKPNLQKLLAIAILTLLCTTPILAIAQDSPPDQPESSPDQSDPEQETPDSEQETPDSEQETPDSEQETPDSEQEKPEPGQQEKSDLTEFTFTQNASTQNTSAPAQFTQKESAHDQCGYDRRCRIDRLKRLNNATRRATILKEERQVSEILEENNKIHLDNNPRINKPVSLGITVTRLGIGYLLGFNFAGKLRLETSLVIHEDWIYDGGYNSDDFYIDGQQEAYFWNIAATYFLMNGWFSPYVNAAVIAGWGSFSSGGYYYDGWGNWNNSPGSGNGNKRDSGVQTTYHIASASAGFDVQLAIGAHARLGIEYGYIIHNQARYSAGNYDAEIRRGLKKWMSSSALWGPQFHIGWAF